MRITSFRKSVISLGITLVWQAVSHLSLRRSRTLETAYNRQNGLYAKPLPEIPLPNDIATRFDPDSPIKRRPRFHGRLHIF